MKESCVCFATVVCNVVGGDDTNGRTRVSDTIVNVDTSLAD